MPEKSLPLRQHSRKAASSNKYQPEARSEGYMVSRRSKRSDVDASREWNWLRGMSPARREGLKEGDKMYGLMQNSDPGSDSAWPALEGQQQQQR